MSQLEDQLTAFAPVAIAQMGDAIDYQAQPDSGPQAAQSLSAIVYETSIMDVQALPGFSAQRGRLPIYVQIETSALVTVRESRDRVKWKGEEYVVAKVQSKEGGVWTLLCV